MVSRFVRFAAPVVAVALLTGPVSAQSSTPTGKKTVVKLFSDVVSKVADSTVRVRMDGKDVALGTVVDGKGYILTKGDDLKGPISVRLRDGSEYDAEYIGYHKDSDLAMLKIDAELPPVSFADSAKAVVGNWVAVAGTDSTALAAGVISAGPRKLYGPESFITNSNRGYLGVIPVRSPDIDGAMIDSVSENSGAEKANLKKFDIITRLNEKTITGPADLQAAMQSLKPGDKVKLSITRGEKEMEVEVKLTGSTQVDRGEMQNKMGSSLSNRRTGFPSVIMHDSVVKPTDCGGPLVDLEGNVLGINIARAGRVESWALPAEVIRPLIPELKSGKLAPPGK
jgi:serine protease Do